MLESEDLDSSPCTETRSERPKKSEALEEYQKIEQRKSQNEEWELKSDYSEFLLQKDDPMNDVFRYFQQEINL